MDGRRRQRAHRSVVGSQDQRTGGLAVHGRPPVDVARVAHAAFGVTPRQADHLRLLAKREPTFEGLTDGDLDRLRGNALREAAVLLARIDLAVGRSGRTYLPFRVRGLGDVVWVVHRSGTLMSRVGGSSTPPIVKENPSLLTLSRNTIVCPAQIGEFELDQEVPRSEIWHVVDGGLRRAAAEGLRVHLDTLGEDGLSGWWLDSPNHGSYNPAHIDRADEERCKKSVASAVHEASGHRSILLMPELAATPPVVAALKDALRGQKQPPLMTIIGLYHERIDDSSSEGTPEEELGKYRNEAVVLAPDGSVLWRHTKMSSAQAPQKRSAPEAAARATGVSNSDQMKKPRFGRDALEDIRLAKTLTMVPTALGLMGVVICLDVIVKPVIERLRSSGIDILAVPSLSPTVRRHRNALQGLVDDMWAMAFGAIGRPGDQLASCPAPTCGPEARGTSRRTVRSGLISGKGVIDVSPYKSRSRPSFVYELGMKC